MSKNDGTIFIAVSEKGATFVKELAPDTDRVNLVGKIDATRVEGRICVASQNGIGVNLDVGGAEKRFVNGDLVVRMYRAFHSESEALDWIHAQQTQVASTAA